MKPTPLRAPQNYCPQAQCAKPPRLEDPSPDCSHSACGMASRVQVALGVRERAGTGRQLLLAEFWVQAHSQTVEPHPVSVALKEIPGSFIPALGLCILPNPLGQANAQYTPKEGLKPARVCVQLCDRKWVHAYQPLS